MRCPATCPHCGAQCRFDIPGMTPTGPVPTASRVHGSHKGRHETPPPPGKENGHTWPNEAHADDTSLEYRLEKVADWLEAVEYFEGGYVSQFPNDADVVTEVRAIRQEYLRRRYHATRKGKR